MSDTTAPVPGEDLVDAAERAPHDKTVHVDAAMMRAAIGQFLTGDGWSVAWEVADSSGFSGNGWADAIAINLWPSRGHAIEGFEVKVSKADWKKELENPAKAERFHRFCNRWWVAARAGVVEIDELPPGWGLLEYQTGGRHKGKLIAVRKAEHRQVAPPPLTFVAAYLKAVHRHHNQVLDRRIKDEVERRVESFREFERSEAARQVANSRTKFATLEAALKAAEVSDWDSDDASLCAAIAWVVKARVVGKTYGPLRELVDGMAGMAAKFEDMRVSATMLLEASGLQPPQGKTLQERLEEMRGKPADLAGGRRRLK